MTPLTEAEVTKLLPIFHAHPADVAVVQFQTVEEIEREMLDGCDTSMKAQLDESGYGSGGIL